MSRVLTAFLTALTLLAAPAAFAADTRAPQPAKAVDLDRFYSGRWLEIARLPMGLTDGCVAGATTYSRTDKGRIQVVDTCRDKTPTGKEKSIKGKGDILDPGTNAKLRVHYPFFITWDYWVLDHADDYSWFISADPKFEKLWIYTRKPPTEAELAALVKRAQDLGYDTGKLEFPAPLTD
ncbi:MAG: lipocalin family protein [Caulobacter sp.]|nr:lipocalin family protein [Caulobacter sp.]